MATSDPTHSSQIELIERINSEGPIGVTAIAKKVMRHPATVARWCIDGIRRPDGRVLKMESYRLGGKLQSSLPALLRFIARQQEQDEPQTIVTPSERRRADTAAEAVLDAAGI